MALTPEDVVNKRFQPTKFREGYDQDEVDDFLDEVVVELRRLNQENEELRQRLIAGESRISELQRSAGQQAPAFADQSQFGQPQLGQPQFGQPQFGAAAMAAASLPMGFPSPNDPADPGNTNNLLQLARKLHEEHVREGIEKRDSLIAEGHATAARVVSDAEALHRQKLSSLDQERQSLERRIDELRTFEREYRQKLKSYIEGQLHELEAPSGMVGSQQQMQQPMMAPQMYNPMQQAPQPAGYQGFGGN